MCLRNGSPSSRLTQAHAHLKHLSRPIIEGCPGSTKTFSATLLLHFTPSSLTGMLHMTPSASHSGAQNHRVTKVGGQVMSTSSSPTFTAARKKSPFVMTDFPTWDCLFVTSCNRTTVKRIKGDLGFCIGGKTWSPTPDICSFCRFACCLGMHRRGISHEKNHQGECRHVLYNRRDAV